MKEKRVDKIFIYRHVEDNRNVSKELEFLDVNWEYVRLGDISALSHRNKAYGCGLCQAGAPWESKIPTPEDVEEQVVET